MEIDRQRKPKKVIGPFGEALSLNDLPKSNTTRWVIRRKAEVVAAVTGGLLSLEEACDRYDLSLEEFLSWQESIDKSGLPGLRISYLSKYRTEYRARQEKLEQTGSQSPRDPLADLH
ncbi:DUF1153 domain-containing protein [Sphingorhabdus sp. YGSMI21]|uniref:CtrA inhibitor SciP n=1 Tax=Sphingorhabdus sp. YGSMI21 TaxID=2077182 RepID=UPI000C1F7485|nr:DUF1153 domain-containing protein [Sphingorhabdus sp. YGSMI21]ATW03437.1 hypothetical protein CHN51_07755 [Sphingorhabdus sp. YGSMI21]